MGAAGRAAAALPGGHVEGFGDTFARPLPGDLRRRRRRPPDASTRATPTFADGHDEMLVNDAIAESARLGRWVDVVARRRSPCGAEAPPMRLGLLTAPFPETPLDEVADWTAANGFESLEIACWPRTTGADPALRRHLPHRRREPVGEPGRRDRRRDRAPRA